MSSRRRSPVSGLRRLRPLQSGRASWPMSSTSSWSRCCAKWCESPACTAGGSRLPLSSSRLPSPSPSSSVPSGLLRAWSSPTFACALSMDPRALHHERSCGARCAQQCSDSPLPVRGGEPLPTGQPWRWRGVQRAPRPGIESARREWFPTGDREDSANALDEQFASLSLRRYY